MTTGSLGAIVVVSGDYASGKTYWGLNSPFGPIAVFDTEMSAEPYTIAPWDKKFQFDWFPCLTFSGNEGLQTNAQKLPSDKYGTIMVDTADQVWRWFVKVAEQKHPDAKQSGLKWGLAKDLMRDWILMLKSKAQWVVLTTHLRLSWGESGPMFVLAGGKREKVKEPKAPEPIWELASLFFTLSRDINTNNAPTATTLKKRYPGVKPKIPNFTWAEMLHQMTMQPEDWGTLADNERVQDEKSLIEEVRELVALGIPVASLFTPATIEE